MKSDSVKFTIKMSVACFSAVIVFFCSHPVLCEELSATQKEVWKNVEIYWQTWKDKTAESLGPFYHKDYVFWGAEAIWPSDWSSLSPPTGGDDGLGGLIESFELTPHKVKISGNLAIIMYENKVEYSGKLYTFRCSDTWVKETDKWQLIGSMRDSCSTLPKCPSSAIKTIDITQRYEELAPIGFGYGQSGMPYGEGRHPGIDYEIPIGTPIVAVSDGIIDVIGAPYKDKYWGGGIAVRLKHADDFFSDYAHLSKVYVTIGQHVKRGERLGLSGQSNNEYPHLHFGLFKNNKRGSGLLFSQSYNPNDFWLNGRPQCFDPNKDYSKNSFKEITFPVECSEPR